MSDRVVRARFLSIPYSACLGEHFVKQFRGDGARGLVALDVVLHRDPRIGVPEEFEGKDLHLGRR